MHDYDEGVADDARDRRDIADEIEVELLIKRRIDGVVRCGKEEGIAIWGSADDRLGAEIGASAGPVFDDERLAEPLRQPLADHARDDVSRAARGKWHDQTHRPRRIGLRPRETRHDRQRGGARGQMQKSTTGKFHFEPPFTSFDDLVGAGEQSGAFTLAICTPSLTTSTVPLFKKSRPPIFEPAASTTSPAR